MKNFRFLKVIALLTMVAMMLSATVSAAVIDRAVYNVNTDTITISGNMQEVNPNYLSDNLLTNSDCSGDGGWVGRGLVVSGQPNAVFSKETDSTGNSYYTVSGRNSNWSGICQNIGPILVKYGLNAKYRISGRVKAGTSITDTAKMGGIKINIVTKNKYYGIATVKPAQSSSGEWVEFAGEVTIDSYGKESSATDAPQIDYWAPDSETTNLLYIETTSPDGTKDVDTRDISVDDITMQYVGRSEIKKVPETAMIRVANATNDETVYVNEFDVAVDGNYKMSFQLPDSVNESATELIAYVNGINTIKPASKLVEIRDVKAKTTTVCEEGVANISFEIFDILDSSGYGDLIALAASYTPSKMLYHIAMSKVDINLNTNVVQSIKVNMPTNENGEIIDGSYTKLMFVDSMSRLSPLCKMLVDENGADAELILVGDSIVVGYEDREGGTYDYKYNPQRGWGEYIDKFFNNNITVNNCAHGGFSTATFMQEDEAYHGGYYRAHTWNSDYLVINSDGKKDTTTLTKILPQIDEGDYVIVCLGINDDSSGAKYTSEADYKRYLAQMHDDTVEKGAEFIFITPSTHASNSTGEYINRWEQRGTWMKEVAEEKGAICLDLGQAMTDKYNLEGEDIVKTYHLFQDVLKKPVAEGGFGIEQDYLDSHTNTLLKDGKDDMTHVSTKGAEMLAELIVDLLEKTDSSLKNYIAPRN